MVKGLWCRVYYGGQAGEGSTRIGKVCVGKRQALELFQDACDGDGEGVAASIEPSGEKGEALEGKPIDGRFRKAWRRGFANTKVEQRGGGGCRQMCTVYSRWAKAGISGLDMGGLGGCSLQQCRH